MEVRGAPVKSVLSPTYSTHCAVKDHSTVQSTVNQYCYWSTLFLHYDTVAFYDTTVLLCCVCTVSYVQYLWRCQGPQYLAAYGKPVLLLIYWSTLHCTMTLLHRMVRWYCYVKNLIVHHSMYWFTCPVVEAKDTMMYLYCATFLTMFYSTYLLTLLLLPTCACCAFLIRRQATSGVVFLICCVWMD